MTKLRSSGRACGLCLVLAAAGPVSAAEHSYTPSPAIGTDVAESGIHTHLDKVTYTTPQLVSRRGLTY